MLQLKSGQYWLRIFIVSEEDCDMVVKTSDEEL